MTATVSDDVHIEDLQPTLGTRKTTIRVGGTGPGNVSSIQTAIDLASAGDTIKVYDGVFYENVFVNITLSLTGNGTSRTWINGKHTNNVITVNANRCNITGFNITNSGNWPGAGIFLDSVSNVTIKRCNLSYNYRGVYADSSNRNTLQDSNISDNAVGVYLAGSNLNKIRKSKLDRNQIGIYLDVAKDNQITDNSLVSNTGTGIYLWDASRNNTLKNCTTVKGASGIVIDDFSTMYGSDLNKITNSNCSNNSLTGISIHMSDLNLVSNCKVLGNGRDGMTLNISTNNTLQNNNVSKNGRDGLVLRNSGYNAIRNSSMSMNGCDGLLLYNSANNTMRNNTINTNGGNGIFAHSRSNDNSITLSKMIGNGGMGVVLGNVTPAEAVQRNLVYNNNLRSDYCGGVLIGANSSKSNITGNTISYCGGGNYRSQPVGLELGSGICLIDAPSNVVWANNISNTAGYGILLLHSSYTTVANNNIVDTEYFSGGRERYGICLGGPAWSVPGSDHNTLRGNIIDNTLYYGLFVSSDSDLNSIDHNYFIENDQGYTQAWDAGSSNAWNDATGGNYWSDWVAPDVSLPFGIVDLPYDLNGTSAAADGLPLCPNVLAPANLTLYEDIYVTLSFYVEHAYLPRITAWVVRTNASWLLYASNGSLWGTPQNSDVGTYWINVSVYDEYKTVGKNVTIEVLNVNDIPIILTADNTSMFEDVAYYTDYNATDIDPTNDVVTWGLNTTAPFLQIDAVTGELSGLATNEYVGDFYKVEVLAFDGRGGVGKNSFGVSIFNTNDPAFVNHSAPDISFAEDTVYTGLSLKYVFSDSDNDTLIFRGAGTKNLTVSLDLNGTVTIVPKHNWNGMEAVWFFANDTRGEVSDSVNVTVTPVNDAPIIGFAYFEFSFPEDTVDRTLDLHRWFGDIENDTLTYRYEPAVHLAINVLPNGTVELTPPQDWSGTEQLKFYAKDGYIEINDSVTVTVLPVNDAPAGLTITLSDIDYIAGRSQPAFGNATDADIPYGDSHTFKWTSNVSGPVLMTGKNVNLSLETAGWHLITLNVTDSEGAWSTTRVELEVLPVPEPPIDDDGDLDDDGMPDAWEMENFGDLDAKPGEDPDKDGLTNLQEFQQGKDPNRSDLVVTDDDDDDTGSPIMAIAIVSAVVLIVVIVVVIVIVLIIMRKRKADAEAKKPQQTEDSVDMLSADFIRQREEARLEALKTSGVAPTPVASPQVQGGPISQDAQQPGTLGPGQPAAPQQPEAPQVSQAEIDLELAKYMTAPAATAAPPAAAEPTADGAQVAPAGTPPQQ